MAVMYIRGAGMSSEDRAREESSVSSLKEETEYSFPDGDITTGVPAKMTDDERQVLAKRISTWEKDGLIQRKNSGGLSGQSLKDTRARYGAPREWDHFQLSFDRAESDSLTPEQLDKARRAVIEVIGKDLSGLHRKMTISRIHTDTGNTHIDAFVHRHAYNASENAALPADELTAPSRLASTMEQINKRLRAQSLPTMADVKKQDGQSLYQESATSDKAKAALNEMVAEAGGVPTQRTGAPAMGEAPIPISRIADPDAAGLERLVRDAERDAKQAAQRLVDAQNALEAQRQRTELRERVAGLEADVQAREAVIAERNRVIESERLASAETIAVSQAQRIQLQETLEKTEEQLETMGEKFASATHERGEALMRINGLESDYEVAQDEIGQQKNVIDTLESDLSALIVVRDDLAIKFDRSTVEAISQSQAREIAEQSAKAETARAEEAESALDALQKRLSEEQATRVATQARLDQEQLKVAATAQALAAERSERTQERSLFGQLKAGYLDTISAIKDQLQIVKDQLIGVTSDRDELRIKRQAELEKTRALATAIEKEKAQVAKRDAAKDAEIETLKQRVADLEGGSDNDGGGKATPPKPPSKR